MAQELSQKTRDVVRARIKAQYLEYYDQMTPAEDLAAAIKVIAQDFYIYCERNLMIQDKISGLLVS